VTLTEIKNGKGAPTFVWDDCGVEVIIIDNPDKDPVASENKPDTGMIVGIVLGCLLLMFCCVLGYCLYKRNDEHGPKKGLPSSIMDNMDVLPVAAAAGGPRESSAYPEVNSSPPTHFYPGSERSGSIVQEENGGPTQVNDRRASRIGSKGSHGVDNHAGDAHAGHAMGESFVQQSGGFRPGNSG